MYIMALQQRTGERHHKMNGSELALLTMQTAAHGLVIHQNERKATCGFGAGQSPSTTILPILIHSPTASTKTSHQDIMKLSCVSLYIEGQRHIVHLQS